MQWTVCLFVASLIGCAHGGSTDTVSSATAPTEAEAAAAPTEAEAEAETHDLPVGCHAAPTPDGGPAFDCEDGSFTLEHHPADDDVEARLERLWHEALGMLQIVGAELGSTSRLICGVQDVDVSCLRIRARMPDGTPLSTWLAAGVVDGASTTVECNDLRGEPSLHPVCSRWLTVPAAEGEPYP